MGDTVFFVRIFTGFTAVSDLRAEGMPIAYFRATKPEFAPHRWHIPTIRDVFPQPKEEEVDLSHYLRYADAGSQLDHFLDEAYMNKRIHATLGCLAPIEFEAQRLSLQPLTKIATQ